MEEKAKKASVADPWLPYILMRRFWRKTMRASIAGDGGEQSDIEDMIR